jgi:hypothetical protein
LAPALPLRHSDATHTVSWTWSRRRQRSANCTRWRVSHLYHFTESLCL